MHTIVTYRKAIVAALIAGLTTASAGLADGHLSTVEIVAICLAVLGGGGITYAVPNAPATPTDSTSTDDTPGA